MKMLRNKSLFSLIYAIMLAIPLVAVISKVIYVQSNKNAYESYYGETINQEIIDTYDNASEIKQGDYIYVKPFSYSDSENSVNGQNNRIIFETLIYNNTEYTNMLVVFWKNANSTLFYINVGNVQQNINSNNIVLEGTVSDIYFENSVYSNFNNKFYTIEYNKYSYLDNVFEYAVDQTIAENNYGNIPLVDWLSSMFLSDNQVNNRYIHYANWYMNYILLISCAYILFLVLMWFINFARKLLERGMNYDF